jgi:hypothetical protein
VPDISRVFITEIVKLHGLAKRIISDKGIGVFKAILDEFPRGLGNTIEL